MSAKRALTPIVLILFIATAVSCITLCGHRCAGGLRFVGTDELASLRLVKRSLVVVTHGWIEKGEGSWPEEMAVAIQRRVDSGVWLCGYFDWAEGARTVNPTDAARYARDVAGAELTGEIIKLGGDFEHIHLIGHSGGCWAISEAAKKLVGKTKADLHLTFLDAYVPVFWEESLLGDVNVPDEVKCWAEHYYTRDYTLQWTQQDLTCAHNVDITSIDQGLKDHNFPWRWYYATISGKYPKGYFWSEELREDDSKIVWTADGIEYGFLRGREAATPNGWERSLKLSVGNKAVKLERR